MRRMKYGNHKVMIDKHTFDSKVEAIRYNELKLLERAGEIKDLKLQPEFEILEQFRRGKKVYKAIKYRADFGYRENGKLVIEDVKSIATSRDSTYRIKKKMVIHLLEVVLEEDFIFRENIYSEGKVVDL